MSESNITFHHLFVRGWDSAEETLPYPRASGDFAVYTPEDFMDSINYAVHRVKKSIERFPLFYKSFFLV